MFDAETGHEVISHPYSHPCFYLFDLFVLCQSTLTPTDIQEHHILGALTGQPDAGAAARGDGTPVALQV